MSKKVLLVSPKTTEARNLARQISMAGFGVSGIACDENALLEKVRNEKPDIIALDIDYVQCPEKLDFFTKFNSKYAIPYIALAKMAENGVKQLNSESLLGLWCYKATAKDIKKTFSLKRPSKTDIANHNGTFNGPRSNKTNSRPTSDLQIIGNSPSFNASKALADKVAPIDVTILLQGETGSGKEVFAKYIHQHSQRSNEKLISVNCAAIPNNLVESELFGHEKGSFTGATEKRLGKFRMAQNGTIFLDEIGELPLKAQSKLLRTLQEKEVEGVGALETTKIDVRFIAATNKDLKQMVKEGTFRADLYFRLNVFPITLPPLRDRIEDIEPLANLFLKQNASQWQKGFKGFTKESIRLLKDYSWPGNVRELEHVIKRAALLSEKEYISVTREHFGNIDAFVTIENKRTTQTLEEIERKAIIQTLVHCGGKIRGKGGAATLLDIHPNTLDFKIKKLGIEKTKLFD